MTDILEHAIPHDFSQVDNTESTRKTFVRIEPSEWGVTIMVFKDEPHEHTVESDAMAVIHVDACYMDMVRVQLWNEREDSDRDDGQTVVLVESIDRWQPQEDS